MDKKDIRYLRPGLGHLKQQRFLDGKVKTRGLIAFANWNSFQVQCSNYQKLN